MHDPAKKQSVTKPPLRERGRGTAKRWWGRKGIAVCGIETKRLRIMSLLIYVAPPTKPRAALKHPRGMGAVVGIKAAPPTKPRAA